MDSAVLFVPVFAIMRILFFEVSTARLISACFSSRLINAASPVEPHTIIAWVRASICLSISSSNNSKLTPSSKNGVIIATADPLNMLVTPFKK